jgi:hypothetical protein
MQMMVQEGDWGCQWIVVSLRMELQRHLGDKPRGSLTDTIPR